MATTPPTVTTTSAVLPTSEWTKDDGTNTFVANVTIEDSQTLQIDSLPRNQPLRRPATLKRRFSQANDEEIDVFDENDEIQCAQIPSNEKRDDQEEMQSFTQKTFPTPSRKMDSDQEYDSLLMYHAFQIIQQMVTKYASSNMPDKDWKNIRDRACEYAERVLSTCNYGPENEDDDQQTNNHASGSDAIHCGGCNVDWCTGHKK